MLIVRACLTAVALLLSLPFSAMCQDMVGQPVVHLANGTTYSAGKAFAIRWFSGRNLLVLPLHVLGPAGGLDHYINPSQINSQVREIEVRDLSDNASLVRVSKSLLASGNPVEKGSGDVSEDLIAFEIQGNCSLHVFNLSPKLPPVGTRVRLVTAERGSTSGPQFFSGVINQSSNTGLVIKVDGSFQPGASSGAPIIDDKNQLVGMMVGHQTEEMVVASPVNRIYARLYKELGAK